MSNPTITADKTPWYQWDTGLTVTVSGGEMTECHFANRKQGTAYVQAVIKGKAKVPDELLQVAAPITAYGYVEDEAGAQTRVEAAFEVKARNIPADYTYTKTAQKTIRDAEQARDQAYKAAQATMQMVNDAENAADEAKASADAAEKSAGSAEYQAGRAKTNADDAGVAMANAQSFAKQASSNATAAEWAKNHAKTSETNAAASASEAATSAQEAKTAASNAATSAGAAADSAAAAAKSAGDAAASVGAINVIAPKAVVIGAVQTGTGVAIGDAASSNFDGSVALGSGSVTTNKYQISIGNDTLNREIINVSEPTAGNSAATKRYVDGVNTITPPRMGLSTVTGGLSFAIGPSSNVSGFTSAAIGGANTVTNNYSVAIGRDAKTTRDAEVSFGDPSAGSRYLAGVRDPILTNDGANKHYVDTTTSNALTATVTDTLVTVDDAIVMQPLSLSFNGVARQDGTPSVDNPVEVQVVTQPVVTVAGKNLVNIADKVVEVNSNGELVPCAVIPANKTVYVSMMSSGNASPTYNNAASCGMFDDSEKKATYSVLPDSISTGVNKATITPTFIATKHLMFYGYRLPRSSFTMTNYQLEVGGYSAYEPYSSQTVSITLPEEHPYLASLPDGTADEVVIDAYGNATLVARVQKVDVSNLPAPTKTDALDSGLTRYEYWEFVNPPAKLDSAAIAPAFSSVIDYQFTQPGMYVSGTYVVVGAAADPTESLRAGGYLYTTMAEVKAYPLGNVSLPLLKAGVSNVWVDGGMGGQVTMTYKQDANKVIASLKSQIAALASKAASDEASTSEPTVESDPDYSTGEPTTE